MLTQFGRNNLLLLERGRKIDFPASFSSLSVHEREFPFSGRFIASSCRVESEALIRLSFYDGSKREKFEFLGERNEIVVEEL